MTEGEALAHVRARARRQRRLYVALFIVFLVLPLFVFVQVAPTSSGWPWEHPLEALVHLVLWLPFLWFLAFRPARASLRRMTELDHLVPGHIARLRVGFVTVDVPGERPREWSAGRRAARLTLGDEVWLSPIGEDDEPVVAVCAPREGVPFVVIDVPGIHTSLLR